jgi:rhamnopyranosyl-N-acetylglucosaminyl-diphospho-decaprenol beta-1,3/1,4-galactofuranosyltransferase
MKTAAIVVTFNRKELLEKAVTGILEQTKPVDKIFLIDNDSTDGTKEIVQQKFSDPNIFVYVKQQNTGSAGGFATGAKMAYEWGADWIWFLDDDVSPKPNCLEIMLGYENISKCIHPSKHDLHGKEFIWESVYDPAMVKVTFLNNTSFNDGKDFTFVNIGCFEGMLIHRKVVEKIGFPDPRFFTAGDDVAYGFLASLYTNVIFVRDAMITKLLPLAGEIKPQYLYYATRNQFLLKGYSEKYGLFKGRLFYPHLLFFAFYSSIKQTIRNRSIKTLWYIWRGIFDGFRGRFYKL